MGDADASKLPLRSSTAPLLAPMLIVMGALFVAPFAILVSYSVREPLGAGRVGRLTLTSFLKLVSEPLYQQIIFTTLWIALAVVALTLIIGYALALAIMRSRTRYRWLLLSLVVLPLLLSGVIRTFGWIVLLSPNGLLTILFKSLGLIETPLQLLGRPIGVIIGLTHVLLPFMVLAIASNLANIDRHIEEAAHGLGASPIRTFLRVTLPLSTPGITTGTILVFILAMGGFVTQSMLGYGRVQVLPILVFDQATTGLNWPLASAAAITMLAITLVFLFLLQWILRRRFGRVRVEPIGGSR